MKKFLDFFRKYGHKLLTFFIGLAFLSLCCLLVIAGVDKIYHRFKPDNIYAEGIDPEVIPADIAFEEARTSGLEEGSKEFFELYIANFVKQNPSDFTEILSLHPDYLISYGIWQAIEANGQGIYTYRDDNTFLVPRADVEKYALYSFNYPGKIKHHTVDVCGVFKYDKLSKCYRVDPSSVEEFLAPDVVDVKYDETQGTYTLLVDLYYSNGLTEGDISEDKTRFSRRLSIVLQAENEVEVIDGVEETTTNYLYVSCQLVDETLSNQTTGEETTDTDED